MWGLMLQSPWHLRRARQLGVSGGIWEGMAACGQSRSCEDCGSQPQGRP